MRLTVRPQRRRFFRQKRVLRTWPRDASELRTRSADRVALELAPSARAAWVYSAPSAL